MRNLFFLVMFAMLVALPSVFATDPGRALGLGVSKYALPVVIVLSLVSTLPYLLMIKKKSKAPLAILVVVVAIVLLIMWLSMLRYRIIASLLGGDSTLLLLILVSLIMSGPMTIVITVIGCIILHRFNKSVWLAPVITTALYSASLLLAKNGIAYLWVIPSLILLEIIGI